MSTSLPTCYSAPELKAEPSIPLCNCWCEGYCHYSAMWLAGWQFLCLLLHVHWSLGDLHILIFIYWTLCWTPRTQDGHLSPRNSCFPADWVQHLRDALRVFRGTGYMFLSWQRGKHVCHLLGRGPAVSSHTPPRSAPRAPGTCSRLPPGWPAEVHLGSAQPSAEAGKGERGVFDIWVNKIRPSNKTKSKVVTSRITTALVTVNFFFFF